jgi:hypothetical protein
MAIPAVGLVFTLIDPADLHAFGEPLELSRTAAYTFGFLLFWLLGSACSATDLHAAALAVRTEPLPAAAGRAPGGVSEAGRGLQLFLTHMTGSSDATGGK